MPSSFLSRDGKMPSLLSADLPLDDLPPFLLHIHRLCGGALLPWHVSSLRHRSSATTCYGPGGPRSRDLAAAGWGLPRFARSTGNLRLAIYASLRLPALKVLSKMIPLAWNLWNARPMDHSEELEGTPRGGHHHPQGWSIGASRVVSRSPQALEPELQAAKPDPQASSSQPKAAPSQPQAAHDHPKDTSPQP